MGRLSLLAIVILGVAGSPAAAYGQTAEQKAGARALARQGAAAFREGRYEDTIKYFERAQNLVHALPHLLFIARAQIELGKLVEAYDNLLRIRNETLPPNAPPAFQRAQQQAIALIPDVKPRLPQVVIEVEGLPEGQDVEIRVDDSSWGSMFIGVPRSINPGEHRISALADGYRADAISLTAEEGKQQTVKLVMKPDPEARLRPVEATPEPEPAATPEPAGEPEPTAAASTSPVTDSGPAEEPSTVMKVLPYAALGVGAVGLGVGFGFAAKSSSKDSDAATLYRAECPCDANSSTARQIEKLDNDAGSMKTIAIASFAVGGAALAAGGTLLILDLVRGGDDQDEATSTEIRPYVSLGSAGVTGRF